MKNLLTFLVVSFNLLVFSQNIVSKLEIYDFKSNCREVIHQETGKLFEAPNWSKDGKFLIFNQEGSLYKFDLEQGEKQKINTEFAQKCNNDHGISPDGKLLVISNNDSKRS